MFAHVTVCMEAVAALLRAPNALLCHVAAAFLRVAALLRVPIALLGYVAVAIFGPPSLQEGLAVLLPHAAAIFLHVATPDFAPTAGCVAVSKEVLLGLIGLLGPGSMIRIRS